MVLRAGQLQQGDHLALLSPLAPVLERLDLPSSGLRSGALVSAHQSYQPRSYRCCWSIAHFRLC